MPINSIFLEALCFSTKGFSQKFLKWSFRKQGCDSLSIQSQGDQLLLNADGKKMLLARNDVQDLMKVFAEWLMADSLSTRTLSLKSFGSVKPGDQGDHFVICQTTAQDFTKTSIKTKERPIRIPSAKNRLRSEIQPPDFMQKPEVCGITAEKNQDPATMLRRSKSTSLMLNQMVEQYFATRA